MSSIPNTPPAIRLPGYDLICELAQGSMGTVYRAVQHGTGRAVAVKVMRKDLAAAIDAIARFQRETLAATRLCHPNLITVYDAGQAGDLHYYTMELIDGIDLERLVRRQGPLPAAMACDLARQAALGLQHAHEQGIVHRDIKPANLMVTPPPGPAAAGPWVVKILDMGLARFRRSLNLSATLTHEDFMVGTLDYMAPEQSADSRSVDTRADLYSLGCTLYFLLVGDIPFPGRNLVEILDQHRWHLPPAVHEIRLEVSAALDAVIRKLMAKRPDDRYATPAEAAAALEPFCRTGPAGR